MTTGIAVLALATVVSAQGYAFNTNLTVGATGADVVALQKALINMGYDIPSVSSGVASYGYFGSQTKAAVMAYQAAKGIPNTGFVGPLTRGALNGGSTGTVSTGCSAGLSKLIYQGIDYGCMPTPLVLILGGTAGVTTGGTTGTTGTITTAGAEGFITTRLASTPIADSNIRISTDVPVYGIEVKAQGSDMVVDRVILQVAVGVGGAATSLSNPATFIRTLYAYDGSTLLKSWNLGANDFNKDSSDRYYVIASGLNFVVPKDSTKNLTFKIDTVGVSADQSSRYVTIQGYTGNTQNVRSVDGAGLNSYTDMSGSANSRVQIFTTSGNSSLTVTSNSGLTPKSTTNRVSTTDGINKLTMQVIDVKSETGNSILKNVYVATNATSTTGLPTTVYLYDGSTLLASVSGASIANGTGVVKFSDVNLTIPKDTTKSLTVKADFPYTTSGQAASTSLVATGIQFEKPDSTTSSSTNSAIAGNDQYLFSAAPQWKMTSSSITALAGVKDVSSSSLTGTIVLTGTAFGGSMTKPTVDNLAVVFASSTQSNGGYTSANSISVTPVVTVTPTDATVGDGGVYTVTISGTIYSSNTSFGSSQSLFMAIDSIDSTVGGNTITDQTWGIDDFFTDPAALTKGTF